MKYQKLSYYLSIIFLLKISSIAQANNIENLYQLDPATIKSLPLTKNINYSTQAWTSLANKALEQQKAQTIGGTLAYDPGISQTFYSPVANRPIIRALDGLRIRVLQNGMDSFDVSAESVDHAVAIDPLLIEEVEVLRGSSALLYGTSAVGGVVNVIDRSIPSELPEDGYEGQIHSHYSSVDKGWSNGGIFIAGEKNIVVQAHGIYRETNDYSVPDFTNDFGERTDEVANTYSETWQAGAGVAYLLDNGYIGVGFSRFESEYGVPNEEQSSLDVERDRFEVRGSFEPEGSTWLTDLNVSLAYGDYLHDEIEPSGEVASTFDREAFETRLELLHTLGDFKGIFGFQGNFDTFSVSGEENFFAGASGRNPNIAEENSNRFAFFAIEEYNINEQWALNTGGRIEHFEQDFDGTDDRDETSLNGSLGVLYRPFEGWVVSGNFTYTERLPVSAELFSDGPHLAVEAYEVGDPDLDKEKSYGFEASIRKVSGNFTGYFTAYYTSFDNYIFLSDTGVELTPEGTIPLPGDEALAERIYEGVDAEFYGLESKMIWRVYHNDLFAVDFKIFGDWVRARNTTDNENLPRISPWRIGGSWEIIHANTRLGLDVIHSGSQNDVAENEESTDAYTLVNLFGSYTVQAKPFAIEIYAKGTNIGDELARVHTSFLRDNAPLPGASVELGVNVKF